MATVCCRPNFLNFLKMLIKSSQIARVIHYMFSRLASIWTGKFLLFFQLLHLHYLYYSSNTLHVRRQFWPTESLDFKFCLFEKPSQLWQCVLLVWIPTSDHFLAFNFSITALSINANGAMFVPCTSPFLMSSPNEFSERCGFWEIKTRSLTVDSSD